MDGWIWRTHKGQICHDRGFVTFIPGPGCPWFPWQRPADLSLSRFLRCRCTTSPASRWRWTSWSRGWTSSWRPPTAASGPTSEPWRMETSVTRAHTDTHLHTHTQSHRHSRCDVGTLGLTETASREKERLEEKQRDARRERSKDDKEWSTRCVISMISHVTWTEGVQSLFWWNQKLGICLIHSSTDL